MQGKRREENKGNEETGREAPGINNSVHILKGTQIEC
jgi:hypothetical protein